LQLLVNLQQTKFSFAVLAAVILVLHVVERDDSHSLVSQCELVGPSEPILENWPITGHPELTMDGAGPC